MSMPGVKRIIKGQENLISRAERVSLFLELADALRLNGKQVYALMRDIFGMGLF